MKFSVQTDSLKMLKEAVKSNCDIVRFGPEFCEWKIPNMHILRTAYKLAKTEEKDFIYVTPPVSISNLKKIQRHFNFLNVQGGVEIVVNDLGTLNLAHGRSYLRLHLGRQLVYIPARCPWIEITDRDQEIRQVKEAYYQTSLNSEPMIDVIKDCGVQSVDVDWIPDGFPYFNFIIEKGLNLSIHLHLVPVTVTRKCHMARFLGEKDPEICSRPCIDRAFRLENDSLGIELFLNGNVVFRLVKPSLKDKLFKLFKIRDKLLKTKANDFVITMNPITKIESRDAINKLIFDTARAR